MDKTCMMLLTLRYSGDRILVNFANVKCVYPTGGGFNSLITFANVGSMDVKENLDDIMCRLAEKGISC